MSNNKKDFTKPSRREVELTALSNGISSAFPVGDVIKIDGVGYSKSDFLAKVQSYLGPEVAARQGHVALQKLVIAKDANQKPADGFVVEAKAGLIAHFGAASVDTLAAFGVKAPGSRRKATGAETVLRTAKANETRLARDTKGPKQKEAIKGSAPGSVMVTGTGQIAPAAGSRKGAGPAST